MRRCVAPLRFVKYGGSSFVAGKQTRAATQSAAMPLLIHEKICPWCLSHCRCDRCLVSLTHAVSWHTPRKLTQRFLWRQRCLKRWVCRYRGCNHSSSKSSNPMTKKIIKEFQLPRGVAWFNLKLTSIFVSCSSSRWAPFHLPRCIWFCFD